MTDGEHARRPGVLKPIRSGIVVAAVPGFEECHVVARHDFDGPRVILVLGLA